MAIKMRTLNATYRGRTDVPVNVYQGQPITHVEWRMPQTRRIRIKIGDLRAALAGAPVRGGTGVNAGHRILFTIDWEKKTVRPDGGHEPVLVPTMDVFFEDSVHRSAAALPRILPRQYVGTANAA